MKQTYLQQFLSGSARNAKRSEIRELLKVITRPGVISLAGGLPPPELFPADDMAKLIPNLLEEHGASALQYGPTEGDAGLIDELIRYMATDGLPGLSRENILITSASQQGLDLCGRAFLAHGDTAVCGLPSYLGALGAFAACGAKMAGIPLDDDGMRTDLLEERLVDLRRSGVLPKLLYVVPDFQNPSGSTLSLSRRRELLSIAAEFDLLVIEDSPYRELRYEGEPLPSLRSLDESGRVVMLQTFSKILFPGIRLGWIVADEEIISRLTVAKQSVDLCTSSLSQAIGREWLRGGGLTGQVERARGLYKEKRDALLGVLDREIDPAWGVRWTRPNGGFFVWMTLPPGLDAGELLKVSLDRNVAFVTGSAFHCDGGGKNSMRLNFSYPSVPDLEEGILRLALSLRELIERRGPVPAGAPPRRQPLRVVGDHVLEHLAYTLAMTEFME